MKKRHQIKYIHEGEYVAEVDIELMDAEDEWAPYLSLQDAYKLDDVYKVGCSRSSVPGQTPQVTCLKSDISSQTVHVWNCGRD